MLKKWMMRITLLAAVLSASGAEAEPAKAGRGNGRGIFLGGIFSSGSF